VSRNVYLELAERIAGEGLGS